MSWGKEWPKVTVWPEPVTKAEKEFAEQLSQKETHTIIYSGENMFPEINGVKLFVDAPDTKDEFKKSYPNNQYGKFNTEPKVYNNKMPTHDPYTNPNAQVYYECKCGAILDPGTKSFAALNNAASNANWKVRWKANGEGYEPFCVECGKDVE